MMVMILNNNLKNDEHKRTMIFKVRGGVKKENWKKMNDPFKLYFLCWNEVSGMRPKFEGTNRCRDDDDKNCYLILTK